MSESNTIKLKTGLSKSLYIKGLQCYKALYLLKYHPELGDDPSADVMMRFSWGHEVGELAQRLFPGGVIVTSSDYRMSEQLSMTKKAIESGIEVLYEAAFEHDGVMARADIMKKEDGKWNLYEVKSSTSITDVYLDDVSLQYNIVSKSGMPVGKAHVIHINDKYIRCGDLNINDFFTIVDVTKETLVLQSKVDDEITKMKSMLSGSEPIIDIGKHCMTPYACNFKRHCWKHIPEDSIFSLAGGRVDLFDLYRKGTIKLADIPLTLLSTAQKLQVSAHIDGKSRFDRYAVKNFLDTLWYPMAFLDFETYTPVVPAYDGIRPYRQVPFQFSVHIVDKEGAEPKHFEYLGDPAQDSREELLNELLQTIPADACVIVYTSFEKTILKYLGDWFPVNKNGLMQICDNIRDLAEPFRNKFIYNPDMKGAYSIKCVLPSLVPELNYDGLEIRNGGMAMDAYFTLRNDSEKTDKSEIRQALLDYCKLDTYAMVRILDRLRSM